ncbi:MAG: cupin domain-containing protein [Actinobacteria bacterium]|nr:cupin domain-containing protein [Actinomycetota bacterium]MSX78769.1 cupin domain-containing protein [Actinomycetota bacterium]
MKSPMSIRFAVLLSCTALAAALSTGCASDTPNRQADAAVPVSRTPLLTKARATVLGQTVVYPTGTPAEVSSATVTMQPGQETGWHRHDAPLYVQVLEGTVTVEYDGGVVKAYPKGSVFMEATGTYHNGRNLGNEPVLLLTVSIGAEGIENTVARP